MSVTCYPAGDACIAVRANSVGRPYVELPVQRVVHNHRWLAAIAAWSALVVDLCLDAGQLSDVQRGLGNISHPDRAGRRAA